MKRSRAELLIGIFLLLIMGIAVPTSADCSPNGTGGADDITCASGTEDTDGIDGGVGDDTITMEGTSTLSGGNLDGGANNDTIDIEAGAEANVFVNGGD